MTERTILAHVGRFMLAMTCVVAWFAPMPSGYEWSTLRSVRLRLTIAMVKTSSIDACRRHHAYDMIEDQRLDLRFFEDMNRIRVQQERDNAFERMHGHIVEVPCTEDCDSYKY